MLVLIAIGLGFGHFYADAPRRGFLLGALQLAPLVLLGAAPVFATAVHVAARVMDAAGSYIELHERNRRLAPAQLPRARALAPGDRGRRDDGHPRARDGRGRRAMGDGHARPGG